ITQCLRAVKVKVNSIFYYCAYFVLTLAFKSTGPFYNQMPPSNQNQAQSGSYPASHSGHQQSSHYPLDGRYSLTSSVPVTEPSSNSLHTQYTGYASSRMSSSANGPSSHGYYGPGQQPVLSQQLSYEQQQQSQQQSMHSQRLSFEGTHPGSRSMPSSSHEHYGHGPSQQTPHAGHSGPMHRYPMASGSTSHPPTSTSMPPAYGPRLPYSGQSHLASS